MKKISIASAVFVTATSCLNAKVDVINYTDLPIKVDIHFQAPTIFNKSPWESKELQTGESDHCKRDMANIKTGYDVWLTKNGQKDRKIISQHGLHDLGAFRRLDIFQDKDPETGEILYSLYSSGY